MKREEEAIKLDGLNVAQIKELREKSEKFAFQAEVNRMMKLIINSLYRNKEVDLSIVMGLEATSNLLYLLDFPSRAYIQCIRCHWQDQTSSTYR